MARELGESRDATPSSRELSRSLGVGHVLAEAHDAKTCEHCRGVTIGRTTLALIAEMMAGLNVPGSLPGALGAAREPWARLRERWKLFGYQTAEEIEAAIRKAHE